MTQRKRIYVDARWMVGERIRGMGRYAEQLIDSIKNCMVAVVPAAAESHKSLNTQKKGHGFFPWWEQLVFPRFADHGSILLSPYNTGPLKCFIPKGVSQVVVVHDLIYLEPLSRLPLSVSGYQNLGRLYRRLVVPSLIKSADYVLTVSQYSKDQITSRFGLPSSRVRVIPNSLGSKWYERSYVPLERREGFILTVSGESPSKNIDGLLRGYALYREKANTPLPLKVVGIVESLYPDFERLAHQHNVFNSVEFIGHVTDDALMALYDSARMFVFASTYEGFGIPLLEAMARGAPIACSNSTSIPEVVGDAALFFDPISEQEMSDSILSIQHDVELAKQLVTFGKAQAQKFKYEKVQAQFAQFWSDLGVNCSA